MNLNWNPELEDIDQAIGFNPGNFEYHHKRAMHFMSLSVETGKEQNDFHLQARKSLEASLHRNPARAMSWYTLGYVYSLNRYDRLEYLNKWLPLTEECFEEALKCAPRDKYLVFNIAKYWVWRSQLLSKNLVPAPGDSQPQSWEEGLVKFQELFQHYLTLNPDGWKIAFDSVWGTYPEDQIVFGIVPPENTELQSLIMQELASREQTQ